MWYARLKNRGGSFAVALCLSLGFILGSVVGWNPAASAAPIQSDQSGNWDVGTTWDGGVAPGPTDAVDVGGLGNYSVTLTQDESFGNASDDSLWSGTTSSTIKVNNGDTLTQNAGSELIVTGTPRFRGTGGILLNQGTWNLQGKMNIYADSGTGSKFQNAGLFQFTTDGAELNLEGGQPVGASFTNLSGGKVDVNIPGGGVAVVDGGYKFNGNFINQDVDPITITSANTELRFAPPGGGVLDDARFLNLFGTSTGNTFGTGSDLSIGGGWTEINLTSATDLLGFGTNGVRVNGVSAPRNLSVVNAGTTINVTSPGGLRMTGGTDVVQFNGNTLTNAVGSLMVKEGANVQRWRGNGGVFDNKGTLRIAGGRLDQYSDGGTRTINNSGMIEFTATSGIRFSGGSGNVDMHFTGNAKVRANLAAGGEASFEQTANQVVTLTSTTTNPVLEVASANTVLQFSPTTTGILDDALFTSLVGTPGTNSIPASSQIVLGGGWSEINLTSAVTLSGFGGDVGFGGGVSSQALKAATGGLTINVTNPVGLRLIRGLEGIGINGETITNLAGSKIVKETGFNLRARGASGMIKNQGTFEIRSGNIQMYTDSGSGQQFENSGLLLLSENGSGFNMENAATTFTNTATGVIRSSAPTGLASFYGGSGRALDNQGTLEVLSGELDINPSITVPQLSGSSLTGGTWRVVANGSNSRLDLRPAADGSITTIGLNASVVLSSASGGTADFPQLGSIETVQGSLYVHQDHALAVGAPSINVTGTLGGDGILNPGNSILFSNGTLDPSALDGTAGTLTINGDLILDDTTLAFALGAPGSVGGGINDLVTVNGALTLDGALDVLELPGFDNGTYRLFNYDAGAGLTLGTFVLPSKSWLLDLSTPGQVNITVRPVPEPTTGLLLMLGIVALRRRRGGKK